MRSGFIFDKDKCVNCKACTASCILENDWSVSGRQVLVSLSKELSLLSVINLSMACNHCESAVCMTGCPSSAYRRDEITGAVLLDGTKCIGCSYCQWNCPYDAPKMDAVSRTIVKCHLCNEEIKNGGQPACTLACPTGALRYGDISGTSANNLIVWFPDKKLNPAIEFYPDTQYKKLRIFPERKIKALPLHEREIKNISHETSLIIFTFLSVLLASAMAVSFLRGVFPDIPLFTAGLFLTGIISLFHLGRKVRFWRAPVNIRRSPLSREIAGFVLFSCSSIAALIMQEPYLLVIASMAGLVFLVLIDSVYIFSDNSKTVIFHSGQTFLSALIIVSFFSGAVLPFVFMALLKLIFSLRNLKKKGLWIFNIRFFRIALLILPGLSLLLHSDISDYIIFIMFLTGELLDRILFYIDFNPVNIRKHISGQINFE